MDRRLLIVSGLATLAAGRSLAEGAGDPDQTFPASSRSIPPPPPPPANYADAGVRAGQPTYAQPSTAAKTYSEDELTHHVSDFLGVTAESAGAVIERAFKENGRPTGYLAGEEGSAAFVFGLRYGKGLLYMKDRPNETVYWQGPSVGFDAGGNGSRVFVLCYNLQYPDAIFRRFPGVDGSAYFIGGLGLNYQRADSITLAPVRAGVGLRLGANIGYLSYSRKRNIIPL